MLRKEVTPLRSLSVRNSCSYLCEEVYVQMRSPVHQVFLLLSCSFFSFSIIPLPFTSFCLHLLTTLFHHLSNLLSCTFSSPYIFIFSLLFPSSSCSLTSLTILYLYFPFSPFTLCDSPPQWQMKVKRLHEKCKEKALQYKWNRSIRQFYEKKVK